MSTLDFQGKSRVFKTLRSLDLKVLDELEFDPLTQRELFVLSHLLSVEHALTALPKTPELNDQMPILEARKATLQSLVQKIREARAQAKSAQTAYEDVVEDAVEEVREFYHL